MFDHSILAAIALAAPYVGLGIYVVYNALRS